MGAGSSIVCWRQVSQRRMPPVVIVLLFPIADDDLCMQQRVETVDIQTPRMDLKNGVRPCSSTIEQILNALPCSQTSNWKSTAHTTLGASAVGVLIVEVATRLRRRRWGTRSPSSHDRR